MISSYLSGLRVVIDRYDYFLLDIFGLLHNGERVNPGTLESLHELKKHGKKICLVSNTPRLASQVAEDLVSYNIDRECYDEIVTAGESAKVELTQNYKGKKVFFLGNERFSGAMDGLGMLQVRAISQADFILNAIPGSLDVDESQLVAILHEAKDLGLKMVCANPDLVVHIGETLHTCAGTWAALYEQIGGEVSWHGKPYTAIYDLAFNLMGNPPKSRVCAMGDALRTDIQGANNYGIDGIWSLTGIHWDELRDELSPDKPDAARIQSVLANNPQKPSFYINGFNW